MPEYSTIIAEDFGNVQTIPGFEKLSSLLEQFYNVTGLASFIADLNGSILHKVGWKSVCMEFNEKHKISLERCLYIDTILADRKKIDERYSICICQNGMVNIETPISIDGVRVAKLYIGQFFFDVPDKDLIGESVHTTIDNNIKISSHILLGLIGDILDLSRIEANKLELEIIAFNLDDVLQNTISQVSVQSQEKGLNLKITVDDNVPQHLIGDPLRLGQILSNLSSNAVKLTDTGDINIYINGLRGDQIPLSARIMALADVYDALRSKRIYKEAYSHEKALKIIVLDSGKHFDPSVTEAFLKVEQAFERTYASL